MNRVYVILLSLLTLIPCALLSQPLKPVAYRSTHQTSSPFPDERIKTRFSYLLKLESAYIERNIGLFRFINDWFGVPYQWGGCNKSGIDCSCFVQTLFKEVYNVNINRTSITQYRSNGIALFRNKAELQLGDLVFFKTNINRDTKYNPVTHVGMYLTNGFFVQSSSSGVNIGNINSGYWANYYVAAGRLNQFNKKTITSPLQNDIDIDLETEFGSNFEPFVFNNEQDSLRNKYARLMGGTDRYQLANPFIYSFIDDHFYAPNLLKQQAPDSADLDYGLIYECYKASCLVLPGLRSEFFKVNNAYFLEKVNLKNAEELDVVKVKFPSHKSRDMLGVYLLNNYILYYDKANKEIAISNLAADYFTENQAVFEIHRVKIYPDAFQRYQLCISAKKNNIDVEASNILKQGEKTEDKFKENNQPNQAPQKTPATQPAPETPPVFAPTPPSINIDSIKAIARREAQLEFEAKQKAKADEENKIAEVKRQEEEEKEAIKKQKAAELAAAKRQKEEERLASEAKKAEEERIKNEAKKAEQERLEMEQRKKEEEKQNVAEEKRKQEELERIKQEEKEAEERRLIEAERKAAEEKKAEGKRIKEAQRIAAEEKKAEEKRLNDEENARIAEAKRQKDEAERIKQEEKEAEAQRILEAEQAAAEAKKLEEKRLKEAERIAAEVKKAEEKRLAAEEKKRLAEEKERLKQEAIALKQRQKEEAKKAREKIEQQHEHLRKRLPLIDEIKKQ